MPELTEPPYWTHDTSLFEGVFRYFGREPVFVRGKLHLAEERYSKSDVDLEVVPLKEKSGTCTYIHLEAYVLVPDIRLTIGLYSQAAPTGAMGEVLSSEEHPRKKEKEIGDGQAWYYPADKTIVLWECLLHPFVQDTPLREDPNMAGVWRGFERFLASHFTEAEQMATTYADPAYETRQYQQFLTQQGYRPHPTARAAWWKPVIREGER